MNAVIIAVGNQKHRARFERCRDFIREELTEIGADLGGFTLVAPRIGEVLEELREASRGRELVLVLSAPDPAAAGAVTGAVCQGLRLEPGVDQELARQLARRAANHDKDWDRGQIEAFAAAPSGCRRIPNPDGMVQGYALRATHQLLLVLPAVQSELTACFEATVRELLAEVSEGVTVQRKLRAVELGEVPVAALLEPFTQAENPRVVLHGQGGECAIDITAAARTLTEAKRACDGTVGQISQRLGPLLTSTRGEPLVRQVGRLMEKKHITLAVAEAGTDGALAAAVRAGSGKDSKVLAGGMNLLNDAQKVDRLGVSRKLLAEAGGTSRRVAAAMAVLVRRAAKSRLGIAITCGEAGAGRGLLAYIAITDGREVWAKKLSFSPEASPEAAAGAACLQAMNMLRLYAQRFPKELPGGAPVEHAAPGLMTRTEKLSAGLSWRLAQVKGIFTGSDDEEENGGDEKEAMELNLLQRIIQKKLTKGDGVRLGILGVSLAVFVGCMIYIGSVYGESHKNKGLIKDLQSLYGEDIDPEDLEGFPEIYLPKFAALWAINEDIAGWIKIEDTQYIDMPVVQYYDNDYYERRDFYGQTNQHGVAFVDYRVAQLEPSTNTIIYAHNMNDGQMFGELLNYKSVAYYREHPLVQYDSVYYEGTWKIFAVVVCKKDDPDFLYHSFIDKKNDQDMIDFVTKIRERSIINTKVDVKTDDQLLTLSTCDYTFKGENGEREARFVVFCRKVREGESLDVDTAGATLNPNPVMPADYYKYIEKLQKEQEEEMKRQQEAAAAAAASKWLTEEEKQSLSAEEAQKLAEQREKDAQEYLSYDERETESLDTLLYLIRQRKTEFKLFLDSEEKGYSLSKRLELVQERRQMAEAAGLTEEDIEQAGDWKSIRQLIEGSGETALLNFIASHRQFLTDSDRSVGNLAALEALLKERSDDLTVRAANHNISVDDYSTYEELLAAITAAESGQAAANQAEKDWETVRKTSDNYKYLNEDDKGKTKAELEELVKQRKTQYTDESGRLEYKAAKDALAARMKNAKSWDDVLDALTYAQGVNDEEREKEEANKNPVPPKEPEEKEDPPEEDPPKEDPPKEDPDNGDDDDDPKTDPDDENGDGEGEDPNSKPDGEDGNDDDDDLGNGDGGTENPAGQNATETVNAQLE